jgi:hypothetical protein
LLLPNLLISSLHNKALSKDLDDPLSRTTHPTLTLLRPMLKLHLIPLFLGKQPIMRAIPAPILRICVRIIGKTAEALVAPDGGEVPAFGVDDVVYFLLGLSVIVINFNSNGLDVGFQAVRVKWSIPRVRGCGSGSQGSVFLDIEQGG